MDFLSHSVCSVQNCGFPAGYLSRPSTVNYFQLLGQLPPFICEFPGNRGNRITNFSPFCVVHAMPAWPFKSLGNVDAAHCWNTLPLRIPNECADSKPRRIPFQNSKLEELWVHAHFTSQEFHQILHKFSFIHSEITRI